MTTFVIRAPWWAQGRGARAWLRRNLWLLRERCARVRPSARLPQGNHLRRDLGLAERDGTPVQLRHWPSF